MTQSNGRILVNCGGAIVDEHGIERVKKQFLEIQYNFDKLSLLREVKRY